MEMIQINEFGDFPCESPHPKIRALINVHGSCLQSGSQWSDQSTNQPTDQWTNQQIKSSIRQSILSIKQSVDHSKKSIVSFEESYLVKKMALFNPSHMPYSGWKKSCITRYIWNPMKIGDSPYQPVGFLKHQEYRPGYTVDFPDS